MHDATTGGGGTPQPSSPSYGIKLVGLRDMEITPAEWLVAYDPDGGDLNVPYPTGHLESSVDPSEAMRFKERFDALMLIKEPSKRTPFRPDGAPNRPLAAFTVVIERIPTTEEEAE